MKLEGGCYCKQVRYEAEGEPVGRIQCHCRECMYITGGSPTEVMAMPAAGFRIAQGQTRGFTRADIANAFTREFCPNCGTHLFTRSQATPETVYLKVGSLDDMTVFGRPDVAFHVAEKLPFHHIPEGTQAFDRLPGG